MIGTVARIVLGALLLASGALKLRDPSWPGAARAMGAPRWSVPFVAPLEIVLGAGLAAGVAEPWPAWLALALLGAFSAALTRVLRRPREERPACACFGRWSSKPVGAGSLLRNGLLAGLAVVVLF
ncbi:MauE/DoxX family redox-associated membrane protein [Candidatus Poriferisodalis multihospitum]|uniref:MauE/DoxX family redox-associated membrane protein n=1 Tax=Candidatus Poriferisodalis multihospitum TaxID=2983191 RepID=UPI002B258F65|nr:MauE/DoxX family redox-associated membrane protein [Candidatus Poriferisodalis multihospitum]